MYLKTQVKKSNALVEASYRLSIQEVRVVLLAIGKAQAGNKEINDKDLYTITAQDYAEYTGLSINMAYRDLIIAQNQLFDRKITLHKTPEGENIKNPIRTRWIQADSRSAKGSGMIQVQFADKVTPYLSLLNKNFTYYELQSIAKLSSAHAVRIYEMLAQWRTTKQTPAISVESFREMLDLQESKYEKFYDLKRRIIQPSIDLINNIDQSDIKNVALKQIKTGRKVTEIQFQWSFSSKRKKEKITDDFIKKNARAGESWDQARKRLIKEANNIETTD